MTQELVIEQWRGGALEAEHGVCAVLCDARGHVLQRTGAACETTWRSAAKPFQLEVSLENLGDTAAGLAPEDLAVGAASHSGEPRHIERVRRLWSAFGLREDDLACGGHWPVHEPSRDALIASGQRCSAVHNNCSGKHTFMVAASRALGAPDSYLEPDHPLQLGIARRIQERTGDAVRMVVVDGCGVPCFALSLDGMARAWAHFAQAFARPDDRGLGRIARAMFEHPWYVSGTGRLDLALVEHATEPVVAKVGAAGLLCVALLARGQGLALKVRSGTDAARPAAIYALLDAWAPGVLPRSAVERWLGVRNVVGRPVGHWAAHFT